MSDERNDEERGIEFFDTSQDSRKIELLRNAKRIVIKIGSSLILRDGQNEKKSLILID